MPGLILVATGVGLLLGALFANWWGSDSHAAAVKASGVGGLASVGATIDPVPPPVAYKGQPVFSLKHCQWGYCVGAVHGPKGWEYSVVMEDYESAVPRRFVAKCNEDEVVR